jgi:pilus assembly protein CpaC
LSTGAIHSFVRAKVSEPDASLNPLAGVPGLRSREAETWFNVHSGESMVIAGLLQRQKGSSQDAVPGLGHLPILGNLFRAHRRDDRATELFIVVTPRIVDTDDPVLAKARQRLESEIDGALDAPRGPP